MGPFRVKVIQLAPAISGTDMSYDNPKTNPDTNAHMTKWIRGNVISIGLNNLFATSKQLTPIANGKTPNIALTTSVGTTPTSKNPNPNASEMKNAANNAAKNVRYP
jgi:hypothetical protein